MHTLRLAARMYSGYKLKALSLLVFITVGLGLIMLGVDALYNSFNSFFDVPADSFLPRYFVAKKAGLDLIGSDYAIADLALKDSQREAIARDLGGRFDLHDVAYFYALLQARNSGKRIYSLVIGVDFLELGDAFPHFAGKFEPSELAEYKSKPKILVGTPLTHWASTYTGEEWTLLSTDYFKDYNGIKVKVGGAAVTMNEGDSLVVPTVYIDISHIKRLLAMPAGVGFPILLRPKRPARALSLANELDMAAIGRAARSQGLSAYSVSTVSTNLYKTYALYRGVVALLSAFLVLVMTAAISANLAINFQNRRADFGLMKAFGCSDRRLLGLVLAENALGLALPAALACLLNAAAGWVVRPFKVLYSFMVTPSASAPGALIVGGAAIAICIVSSIQPYRYLKRVDPVSIMREE